VCRNGLIAAAVILAGAGAVVPALQTTALERIAEGYVGRQFVLRVSLHEPADGATHVPMLNDKGWYFVNSRGGIVLRVGSKVEVTGVFNYSERGFFIELAEASLGFFHEPLNRRRRIRVRVMVEGAIEDPELQYAQGLHLMNQVFDIPEEELPELPEPEDPDSPPDPQP